MPRSVGLAAFVIVVLLSRPVFAQSDIQNLFSQLNEPTTSIPALVRFMSMQADQDNRWRAARILSNINTPASRIALQEDLKHETDPRIKALAERKS